MKQYRKVILAIIFLSGILAIGIHLPVNAQVLNQAPTVDIPTVTSSPSGPVITVRLDTDQDQINVRSGPATYYEKVGVLLAGQSAPAKGKSSGGEWILIEYPGVPGGVAWVYAPLVSITTGKLPVVEPPPTATPLVTNTIDPTLAAQFMITQVPTGLPTFTEPPPLALMTFPPNETRGTSGAGIPMGLIIFGLLSVGILLGVVTIAQH